MLAAITAGITAIGTGVASIFGYKSNKAAAGAQSDIAAANKHISDNNLGIAHAGETQNVVGSYYSFKITEEQQDTIVKVAIIVAVMLVLVTRIKSRK